MHHQTLMFFSLLGTLSVSVGAWCIALARLLWEQYGEQIFFSSPGVQVRQFCPPNKAMAGISLDQLVCAAMALCIGVCGPGLCIARHNVIVAKESWQSTSS